MWYEIGHQVVVCWKMVHDIPASPLNCLSLSGKEIDQFVKVRGGTVPTSHGNCWGMYHTTGIAGRIPHASPVGRRHCGK